jgi:organic radical activating enzyme
VKESWNANLHPPTKADSIVENVKKYANTVVITGGEPLMWSMDYLTNLLRKNNIKTHIETSGAYSFSGKWDWFCLSPKKTKLPLDEVYPHADELKMIIHNKNDFDFAEQQAAKVGKNCQLFLQPEWSKKEKMTEEIVNYVMKNPKWKISLQTHKFLNIP